MRAAFICICWISCLCTGQPMFLVNNVTDVTTFDVTELVMHLRLEH